MLEGSESGLPVRPLTPAHCKAPWISGSLECVQEEGEACFPDKPISQQRAPNEAGQIQEAQTSDTLSDAVHSLLQGLKSTDRESSSSTGLVAFLNGLQPIETASRSCSTPFGHHQKFPKANENVAPPTACCPPETELHTALESPATPHLQRSMSANSGALTSSLTLTAVGGLAASTPHQRLLESLDSAQHSPVSAGGYASMARASARLMRSTSVQEMYTVPEKRVHAGRQLLCKMPEAKLMGELGSKELALATSLSAGSNASHSAPASGSSIVGMVRSTSAIPYSSSMASDLGFATAGRASGSVGYVSTPGSMDDGAKLRGGILASAGSEKRVHGGILRHGSRSSALDMFGSGNQNNGTPSARSSITNSFQLNSCLLPGSSFGQAMAMAGSIEFAESLINSLTRTGSGKFLAHESDGHEDHTWGLSHSLTSSPSLGRPLQAQPRSRTSVGLEPMSELEAAGLRAAFAQEPVVSESQAISSVISSHVSGRVSAARMAAAAAIASAAVAAAADDSAGSSSGGLATTLDEAGNSQHLSSSTTASATLATCAALDLSRNSSHSALASTAVPTVDSTTPTSARSCVTALARSPSLGMVYKVQRASSTQISFAPGSGIGALGRGASNCSALGGSTTWSQTNSLDLLTEGHMDAAMPLSTPAGMLTGSAVSQAHGQHGEGSSTSLLALGLAPRIRGPSSSGTGVFDRMSGIWSTMQQHQQPASPGCQEYVRRPSLLEYAEAAANMGHHGPLSRGVSSGLKPGVSSGMHTQVSES